MAGVRGTGVRQEALDRARIAELVTDDTAGATVTFDGVVRNHDLGRSVERIEYEGHPSAGDVLAEVAEEIAARHPGCQLAVEHRVGVLEVGDVALVAAVSSPHRSQAFSAMTDLIDLVKEKLPVWKRQVFSDGTDEWSGSA